MTPDQFFPGSPEQAWQDQRATLVPDHLDPADDIVQVATQTWLLRSERIGTTWELTEDPRSPEARAWA